VLIVDAVLTVKIRGTLWALNDRTCDIRGECGVKNFERVRLLVPTIFQGGKMNRNFRSPVHCANWPKRRSADVSIGATHRVADIL